MFLMLDNLRLESITSALYISYEISTGISDISIILIHEVLKHCYQLVARFGIVSVRGSFSFSRTVRGLLGMSLLKSGIFVKVITFLF